MVTKRMQKFDELIKRELSTEIGERFRGEFISITQVHVSKDLAFAKVWLSSTGPIDQIVEKLQSQAREIRKIMAGRLIARKVPSLYFVADKTEEQAQKIENLLANIKESDDHRS